MIRFALVLFLALTALLPAPGARAQCRGTDLTTQLPAAEMARIRAAARSVPFGYGNHWLATKGSRRIHVIGTMHSGDSRMAPVLNRLRPIIAQADAVLVESTRAEAKRLEKALKQDFSAFVIQSGPTLPQLLPEPVWERLSLQLRIQGFPPEVAPRIKPWFLSFNLFGSACQGRGLVPGAGLDDRIERMARRSRVPVGSLETGQQALAALSAQPIRDQARMLELGLASKASYDPLMVTLRESYFRDALIEGMLIYDHMLFRDVKVSRSEVRRLRRSWDANVLDRRNRAWMKVIARTPGDLLVIAAGGAHLPGRAGVLNLLRQAGYQLERQPF